MVEVSIICLIYKSTKLAEMIYDSLNKYTPMLKNGKAEFFFVANDPTQNILEFLEEKKYPYIVNYNDVLDEKEMFERGFAKPEYMRRVYRGYNYGILQAKGKRIVLINSDNFFSIDWLENLLKYSEYKNVVSSTLVEPIQPNFSVFPGAKTGNFGRTADTYDEEKFIIFANKIKRTGLSYGGAYMPCILYKDVAIYAGLYPEGNIAKNSFDEVKEYGDIYFYQKLASFGVTHYTAKDSVVYHLKEGEKSESEDKYIKDHQIINYKFKNLLNIIPKDLIVFLRPTGNHTEIIEKLLQKITIVLFQSENLEKQINYVKSQNFKSYEMLIIYDKLDAKLKSMKNVILMNRKNADDIIKFINYDSFGTYILYLDDEIEYHSDFIIEKLNKNAEHEYILIDGYIEEGIIKRGEYLFPKTFVQKNGSVLFFNKNLNINHDLIDESIFKIADKEDLIDKSDKNLNKTENRYIKYSKMLLTSINRDGLVATFKKVYKKISRH